MGEALASKPMVCNEGVNASVGDRGYWPDRWLEFGWAPGQADPVTWTSSLPPRILGWCSLGVSSAVPPHPGMVSIP